MTTDPHIQVRPARPSDTAALVSLSRSLALHVNDPDPGADPDAILAACFGPDPWCECLVAVWEGAVAGFVCFCRRFEAHTRVKSLWIADLAVMDGRRGQGVGRLLARAVRVRAGDLGATAVSFEVWKENHAALSFYAGLGAVILDDRHLLSFPISPVDRAPAERPGRRREVA